MLLNLEYTNGRGTNETKNETALNINVPIANTCSYTCLHIVPSTFHTTKFKSKAFRIQCCPQISRQPQQTGPEYNRQSESALKFDFSNVIRFDLLFFECVYYCIIQY